MTKTRITRIVALIFVFSMVFGGLAILSHEFGHYYAHTLMGGSAVLHYNRVSSSDHWQDPLQYLIVDLAGVGTTVTISLLSLLLMYVTRKGLFLSLGMIMAGRNVAALPLILSGVEYPNDEGIFLYFVILLINLATDALLIKFVKENRLGVVVATILGGSIGAALWLLWLGPLILP